MAFSALLSWETPTTPLRMRIVRICEIQVSDLLGVKHAGSKKQVTYDNRVDKGTPTFFLVKEGQDEGDSGGTEKDNNELILELLKDKLPKGGGRLLGNGYKRLENSSKWWRGYHRELTYSCAHVCCVIQ